MPLKTGNKFPRSLLTLSVIIYNHMNNLNILLYVNEDFFKGILSFILESYFNCQVTSLARETDAKEILEDKNQNIDIFIYEYDPFSFFFDELKKIKPNRKMHTLLICQAEHEQNIAHIEKEHAVKIVKKDQLPSSLIQLICSFFTINDILNDSPYCKISTELLARLDGVRKNLYIKIGENKMIQIFSEHDKTEVSDILKYHKKGVGFLYLKRSTTEMISTQIQRQIKLYIKSSNFKFILQSPTDSPESIYEQRFIRIFDEIFIDDEFKNIILASIKKIQANVLKEKRIDLFISQLLGMPNYFQFFSKKAELTSMFSGLLMQRLQFESKTSLEKIVYASLLSDITLAVRPKLLQIRDFEEFNACKDLLSKEDVEFYLTHPADGAALANKFFQSAPADTGNLILLQHELPDGSGFPNKVMGDKIALLEAIFIVASDLAHCFLANENQTIADYLTENSERWNRHNFKKILRVLNDMKQTKIKIEGISS